MSQKQFNQIKNLINSNKFFIDIESGTIKSINGLIGGRRGSGYLGFTANIEGERVQCYNHQVIAVLIWGDKCIGKEVNHINRKKTDNRAINLELVTRRENILHCLNSDGIPSGKPPIKVNCKNKNTLETYSFNSISEAARALNLDISNISKCIKGKLKSTGGFIFW